MTTPNPSSAYGLEHHGIQNVNNVYWNLSTPSLCEEALRRHEARLAHLGPLVVRTGQYTGRSPLDKFIVREPTSEHQVWWGDVNRPMEPGQFNVLRSRLLAYLQGHDLFVQDCFVGADPQYRLPIRVVTDAAWPVSSRGTCSFRAGPTNWPRTSRNSESLRALRSRLTGQA
jgi:phosphoenolpyruvate carboxykinase (ATP)